jgi:signal transduction histidine kinase
MLSRIAQLLDNLRQVSSDVAHDLRTPLTRMRNRLEEARTRSVSAAEYSSAVARAIEDTDQLLSMFAALLRISQVEAGTRASGFQNVAFSELLEGVQQFYLPAAEDHGQILEADLAEDLRVFGDAELLFQLFSNLIENAICHAPRGAHIRLQAAARGDAVMASVADDGPGIPADEYARVTRRFYRLSSSRSEPGNGLGLALVNAIAGLHGASLTFADAKPGLRVNVIFRPQPEVPWQ